MITRELLTQIRKVVTHENCADGIASAVLVHDVLPEAEIVFCQYGTDAYRNLQAEPGMLFCDFAPPRERAAEFVAAGAIVLDHHKGAQDIVAMFGERGVFADETSEPGVSGALLAFRHIYCRMRPGGDPHIDEVRDDAEEFATLVGVRDTWQRDHAEWEDACALAEGLRFYGWPGAFRETWTSQVSLGHLLRAKHMDHVTRAVAGAYRFTTSKGTRVVVFSGLRLTSDAAELIGPEADLVIGFEYMGLEGGIASLAFSTRSHTGYDCAALCKAFGGGGHTAAAGFTARFEPLNMDVSNPYALLAARLRIYEVQR